MPRIEIEVVRTEIEVKGKLFQWSVFGFSCLLFCLLRHYKPTISSKSLLFHYLFVASMLCSRLQLSPIQGFQCFLRHCSVLGLDCFIICFLRHCAVLGFSCLLFYCLRHYISGAVPEFSGGRDDEILANWHIEMLRSDDCSVAREK